MAQQFVGAPAEDGIAGSARDSEPLDTGDAAELTHVERVIAAHENAAGPERRDEELEPARGVQDRVVMQAGRGGLRRPAQARLLLLAHAEVMHETSGLIRQEAATVAQAEIDVGIALDYTAEDQGGAGHGGLERQSDEVAHIV